MVTLCTSCQEKKIFRDGGNIKIIFRSVGRIHLLKIASPGLKLGLIFIHFDIPSELGSVITVACCIHLNRHVCCCCCCCCCGGSEDIATPLAANASWHTFLGEGGSILFYFAFLLCFYSP